MSESIQIPYIEDKFDIEHAVSYLLLIRLGQSRHDLAIINEAHSLQLLLSWTDKVPNERVKQLLALNFKSKNLVFDHRDLLLIPAACYDPVQNDYYMQQLQLDKTDDTLINRRLDQLEVQSLCSLPNVDLTAIQQDYPGLTLWSKADVLLLALPHILADEGSFLHLNIETECCYFTYFKDKQLVYHQRHITANADDFTYFLLNSAGAIPVDLTQAPVWVSGKINKGHAFFERLSKYANNVRFISPSLLVNDSPAALEEEYDLLTLMGLSCVL